MPNRTLRMALSRMVFSVTTSSSSFEIEGMSHRDFLVTTMRQGDTEKL